MTIMIEDLRDVERKRLLGIDDENAPTREDLAACLEEVSCYFFLALLFGSEQLRLVLRTWICLLRWL